ncbi:MAG: L-threonylcarbamoyladenylate synthase [Patescibacteria group bacterium]|nr:L-threonylcarbamoyladenylate synthase [Patescibacteria group bacterium]
MRTLPLDQLVNSHAITEVIAALDAGGVVVYPTDTVYGLLADATNPDAVARLLSLKDRPPGKAISVFVRDIEMITDLCTVTQDQELRIRELLPGPYTLILPSRGRVRRELESENGTLGVRIPDYAPVRALLAQYGKPVTATSANLSGDAPHYSLEAFLATLSAKKRALITLAVDGGKLPRNKPSTVIDLTGETLTVLRVGDMLLAERQVVLSRSEEETKALARRLLQTFGRPNKPIVFILQGDLGAGKTVFGKGIAMELGIHDVVSPTFVVHYEYDVPPGRAYRTFNHFDLYSIADQEEFEYLEIESLLVPGSVHVIEWGEKLGELYKLFLEKADVVLVRIEHVSTTERRLTISRGT